MPAIIQSLMHWFCAVEYVTVKIPDLDTEPTDANFTEQKGSPMRGHMQFKPPMKEVVIRQDEWTTSRRLKVATRASLAGSILMTLILGLIWLITGSMPTTTELHWNETTAITLPFAILRIWDVLALGLWSGFFGLMGTYCQEFSAPNRNAGGEVSEEPTEEIIPEEAQQKNETGIMITGIALGLMIGVFVYPIIHFITYLKFGFVRGMVFGFAIGLLSSVVISLLFALNIIRDSGLKFSLNLGTGLGIGLAISNGLVCGFIFGMAYGFVLPLPLLLLLLIGLFIPILRFSQKTLARERMVNDLKDMEVPLLT